MRARPQSIILIGFMGSGKSSVGRLLAAQYGWPFFDTDEIIEAQLGMSIGEIFSQRGEAEFRKTEIKLLRELDPGGPAIIVTGGGIILRQENVKRLRELGFIVWLSADLETLQERLRERRNRPLLQTHNPAETIATLLERRKKLYEAAADFTVDTSRLSHEQVAEAIRDGFQITR